jgi:hypothetical protein
LHNDQDRLPRPKPKRNPQYITVDVVWSLYHMRTPTGWDGVRPLPHRLIA